MVTCSIIIINYNTFQLTVDCVRSIHEQTNRATTYEIILVDNGSTECSADRFLEHFPDVRLIKSPVNLGFAKGNNLGIAHASGEFILLLNSDTVLLNDAVSIAIDAMRSDSQIGVLSGQLQYPNGEHQAVAGVFPSLFREIKELLRFTRFYKGERRAHYYLNDLWNYNQAVDADWVWGAFFLFRKTDLEKFPNGKLHDNFFMYFEDVQWCYYFKNKLNKRIHYSPEPKLLHYIGRSDKQVSSGDDKYFCKILPNEKCWMRTTKGDIYTRLYYFTKSLYYLSLRRKLDVAKAKLYRKIALE
jgi:GT2 family glycosyltransferase